MSRLRSILRQRLPPVVTELPTITALSGGPFTSAMTFLDGQVSAAVKLGTLTTQTYALSRYSSSNVKHALVSWVIPSAGPYAMAAIADPGGSFSPTNPSASVTLTISGTTYTATLPVFDTSKTRFTGAVCRECRYLVIPTNGGTPHAFLSVIFDVRSYAVGGHRVDVCVGSTRNNASVNTVTYDVVVTIDGSASYTRTNMEHGAFMRWRHLGYVSLTEGSITHDTSALETLKVVPTYLSTTANPSYTFNLNVGGYANGGLGFDKLRTGAIIPNFGTGGGRIDLGLFPQWDAVYLRHKTTNALESSTRHGDLFGSWSIHITADSGDPEALISIDTVPNWSTQNASPNGPLNGSTGTGMSGVSQEADSAHQPNVTFLPWVLTGDRYYADELAFWANWNLLHQPSVTAGNARCGAEGLMINEQQRGWSWGVRTIGIAGKWLSDAHSLKSYFAEKTQNNLDWIDAYATGWYMHGYGGGNHPLGIIGQPASEWNYLWSQQQTLSQGQKDTLHAAGYTNINVLEIFAPWQYGFMSTVLTHLHHLGYTGALNKLDSLVGMVRELFLHDPDLPFNHALGFWWPHGFSTTTTFVPMTVWGGAAPSVHNLSTLYWGDDYPSEGSGGCPPFTVYGAMGRSALMIGKGRGADNDAIITQLMAYVHPVSGQTMVTNINNQPEWAFTQEFLNQ